MRLIDADKLIDKYPHRRSLKATVSKEREVSIADIVEQTKKEICANYCKMPYKYSAAEWEEVMQEVCGKCPLNRL